MRFLAAGWLTLLIGWLVLAIWLWRREREVVWISTRFWPSSQSSSSRNHERSRPPAWVLAALMSLLAIIFALSGPVLESKTPRITLIVDPHVSMSANADGKSFARALADRFEEDLEALRSGAEVRIVVPGHADALANVRDIDKVRWTAASTSSIVEQRCFEHERQGEAIIVLSAQPLNLPPSAVRYAPDSQIDNRRITRMGASVEPHPQAMVTVEHPKNDSPFTLVLSSSGGTLEHRVEPKQGSESTTVFVDLLPNTGDSIQVRIAGADGFEIDNRAHLARAGGWPRIDIAGEIPQPAVRFAAIYSKQRPAGQTSESILFTSIAQDRQPAVFFAATHPLPQPLTASLDLPWRDVAGVSRVRVSAVASSLPDGFEVLSRVGETPILAVKRSDPRQIWIGCDIEAFAQEAEWVAWMNALVDFLNPSGPPRWEQSSVDAITIDWVPVAVDPNLDVSPGLYRTAKGPLAATNLPTVSWASGQDNSREYLRRSIEIAARSDGFHASKALCAIALGFGAFSGLLMAFRSRLDGRNAAT